MSKWMSNTPRAICGGFGIDMGFKCKMCKAASKNPPPCEEHLSIRKYYNAFLKGKVGQDIKVHFIFGKVDESEFEVLQNKERQIDRFGQRPLIPPVLEAHENRVVVLETQQRRKRAV